MTFVTFDSHKMKSESSNSRRLEDRFAIDRHRSRVVDEGNDVNQRIEVVCRGSSFPRSRTKRIILILLVEIASRPGRFLRPLLSADRQAGKSESTRANNLESVEMAHGKIHVREIPVSNKLIVSTRP